MPDLFDALPSLRRVSHPLLTGRRIRLVGVSAILYDDEAVYFEISKPRFWARRADGTLSIGIGGIGGRIEPGEGPLTCLQREVEEELGVGFDVDLPERTALIRWGEVVDWLHPAPGRRHHQLYFLNLLPPQLGGTSAPDHLAIATYLGRLRGCPRRGDLFGLLTVRRSTLGRFLNPAEWRAEELLTLAGLQLDLEAALPPGSILRLVLTARAFRALWHAGGVAL